MHAHTCTCTYMHVHVCVCMCMHVYACTCMYTHEHAWTCVIMCAHAWICMYMHVHACACACTHMYMHVHAWTCMYRDAIVISAFCSKVLCFCNWIYQRRAQKRAQKEHCEGAAEELLSYMAGAFLVPFWCLFAAFLAPLAAPIFSILCDVIEKLDMARVCRKMGPILVY